MVRLRIAPGPAEAVATAVEVLSRWIDPEHLRLGGGTALEARWHHRDSTDLDFFVHGDHADAVFYGRADEMARDLADLATQGVVAPSDIRISQLRVVHFRVGTTPVSMGRTEMLHGDPSGDAEYSTGVSLASTRDILTKKIRERLGGNQIVTERDAYDFIVAGTEAPEDLRYAWRQTPEDRKRTALVMYRSLVGDDRLIAPVERRLVNPTYPVIAENLWQHALELLQSDLAHVPALR